MVNLYQFHEVDIMDIVYLHFKEIERLIQCSRSQNGKRLSKDFHLKLDLIPREKHNLRCINLCRMYFATLNLFVI